MTGKGGKEKGTGRRKKRKKGDKRDQKESKITSCLRKREARGLQSLTHGRSGKKRGELETRESRKRTRNLTKWSCNKIKSPAPNPLRHSTRQEIRKKNTRKKSPNRQQRGNRKGAKNL